MQGEQSPITGDIFMNFRALLIFAAIGLLQVSNVSAQSPNAKWNCKPKSVPNEGSFDLSYEGKSPISGLFGITDSATVGDGLDGLKITANSMGETSISFNDETEVGANQIPYDVTNWGNNLPPNKGGIQYTLILPKVISSGVSFLTILWKVGPTSSKVTYDCTRTL
jgi:hypothetical protein